MDAASHTTDKLEIILDFRVVLVHFDFSLHTLGFFQIGQKVHYSVIFIQFLVLILVHNAPVLGLKTLKGEL